MDLKLQTYSTRFLIIVLAVVVGLMATCLVVGIFATPHVLEQGFQEFGLREHDIELRRDNMTSFNQMLVVWMTPGTPPQEETIVKHLEIEFEARGGTSEQDSEAMTLIVQERLRVEFRCEEGTTECAPVELLVVPFIRHESYVFQVRFVDRPPAWITQVLLEWEHFNPQYSIFELAVRSAFLLLTVLSAAFFWWQLRHTPIRQWAVEQQWTSILIIFLIGLNDPLFALSLRFWVFDLLDQILASSFLAVLMLFWLVMFDSLLHPDPSQRSYRRFYLPKALLMLAFWLCTTLAYMGLELFNFPHPLFLVFFILALVLAAFYVLYLGYMSFSLLPQLRQQVKIQFFFGFTIFVIVGTVCGILFGALGPLAESGVEILAFFGLFNFYVSVLIIMYLPAGSTPRGLEMISIGSDVDDMLASDLDLESSNDFEISLSDVGIQAIDPPDARSFSPVPGEFD